MGRKKVFLLLIFMFMTSLFSSFVSAQEDNFLNRIFEPFAGINVADTYDRYWQFIDAFLYFLLFIGIVQFALSKQFEGRGGKAVIIAFGIALSIGITLWTSRNGFKLGERLGPIAGAIFAIIFFIFIVRIFRGDKEGFIGPAWWLAVGAAYIFVNMLVPEVFTFLEGNRWGAIGVAVFNLLFLIAIFYGVPSYFSKHFRGEEGVERGERRGWGGLWPGGEKAPKMEKEEEEEEEKKIKEEEKKALGLTERERELMGKIIDADTKDIDTDTKLKQYLTNVRNFVQAYLASPFSRAGIRSYDQFRRRKESLITEIEKVLEAVKNREERDKKINEIIKYNRGLLNNILNILKGIHSRGVAAVATKSEKDKIRSALRERFKPNHIPIGNELIKATDRATRITNIEKHLNEVILKQHEERRISLEKIEENLNKVLEKLRQELPRIPRGYSVTRGPFRDVVSLLEDVIKELQNVIDIDTYTLKREKQMYEEDKFLEVITSKDPI